MYDRVVSREARPRGLIRSLFPQVDSCASQPALGRSDRRARGPIRTPADRSPRGSTRRNTGQVVAELKVVTSHKLCEPNASNCPNETDEASSCPKQDMYVFCKAEQEPCICVTFRIMGQPRFELGFESRRYISGPSPNVTIHRRHCCLLYTSPSPRDRQKSRMPSSA